MDRRRSRRRFLRFFDVGQAFVVGLLVATPMAMFLALRTFPPLDLLFQNVLFHLVVVSAISGSALIVALVAAVAAARAHRFPLAMLALGCLSIGLFMLSHGLTTPGIWHRSFNMWVARFPVLALAAFALFLAAALFEGDGPVIRGIENHAAAVLLTAGVTGGVLCAAAVLWPLAWIGSHPVFGEIVATRVVAAVAAVVLLATGEAHRRRWRLSRDRVELALFMASWLSTESIVSLQLGVLWRLSWWDYHVLLLLGFAGAAYAVVTGYRRSKSAEGAVAGVMLRDTIEQIQHGYPGPVRSLVQAVEAKDAYTRGHSARVAELSVRLGETLGLGPKHLRALAQGGLLHDIGKIGVPDQILNKPGVLTPEEREEIERHPEVGWEIVRQASSLHGVLAVVRHHHERYDGTGYPAGLAGDAIPFEARIAAVADVWDALTSDRAYRPAWSHERALDFMVEQRGRHFAQDAIDALLEILESAGIPAHAGAHDADDVCHPSPLGAPGVPARR